MKKVTRWQCGFCQKTTAKPETMAAHEKECIKNPEGRNCYMCERAVLGGYRQGYGGEYWDESMAFAPTTWSRWICSERKATKQRTVRTSSVPMNCTNTEREKNNA